LGADTEAARLAASISQGHIGKARAAIQSREFQSWRSKAFQIFLRIKSEASAIRAAGELIALAEERAELRLQQGNEKEESELRAALSSGTRGLVSGGAKALKDLEKDQKARLNRTVRDELDNSLIDYASFLRDVLAADDEMINLDLANEIQEFRGRFSPERSTRLALRLQEIRELLATNASQTLLLESFFTEVAVAGRGN
jgi:DNA polymerase-3 subunit delta'